MEMFHFQHTEQKLVTWYFSSEKLQKDVIC
jgi:hypothetical protein